jgi:crotonobetainyl-CoA:carnitine CoA-transferase CaiB-like acyl-CoA transferase
MVQPLDGVRVLDLSRLTPGAYATLHLADLGADVIKVEEPRRGDYMRELAPAGYLALNRGKRSIAVDLKQPRGREVLFSLADSADVLVESFRPGVLDRLGVGYDELSARAPRLIYCAMSGYGQSGPYRDLAGHDLNYQGLSGFAAMFGTADEPIKPTGMALGDLSAALFVVIGICSALVQRDRTGIGQYIDVSITDVLVSLTSRYLAEFGQQGVEDAGEVNHRAGYGVFQAADGQYVSLGCIEEVFWHRFLDSVDVSVELAAARDRTLVNVDAVNELVAAEIRRHDSAFWLKLGREHDVPFALANRITEVANDEYVRGRHLLHPVDGHDGVLQARFPLVMSGAEPVPMTASPALGEHTDAILAEYGLSSDQVADLRAAHVVR